MANEDVLAPLESLYKAWAVGDADGVAATYIEAGTVALPGVFRDGRDVIRRAMAEDFAGRLKGSRTASDVVSIRRFGDDAAIVVSSDGVFFGDEAEPRIRVKATWTVVREDGEWLIAAYHNCPETVG